MQCARSPLLVVYERTAAKHNGDKPLHGACVYRVLQFQNHHKQRLSQEFANSPSLQSRLLSQKEVVGRDKLSTVSSLHLPMASWSPTSTLRAQPASRLHVAGNRSVVQDALLLPHAACGHARSFCSSGVVQSLHSNSSNCCKLSQVSQIASLLLADTSSPAVGASTVFGHQSTGRTPDHQQIAVYRPSTDVAPFASNAAMLSSAATSRISSDACSDSTAGSRMFEWQVWP